MKRHLLALSLLLLPGSTPAFATALPASGQLGDNTQTVLNYRTRIEALHDFIAEMPDGGAEQALTLSGDTIVPAAQSARTISVDTEGGAPTDNLSTITNTNIPDGAQLLIHSVSTGRVPTVKNGAGNILTATGADFALLDPSMIFWCQRKGSSFVELGRFYGNQPTALRTSLGLGTAALSPTGTTTGASPADIPTVDQADGRYAPKAGNSSQSFNVAGSPSGNNAVNKTVADADYAALAGNTSQQFSAADPSSAQNVVTKNYGDAHYSGTVWNHQDVSISAGKQSSIATTPLTSITWIRFSLVCLTNGDGGYQAGEEVWTDAVKTAGTDTGVAAYYDGSGNIQYQMGASSLPFSLPSRLSGQGPGQSGGLTNARWNLRIYYTGS